jgi:hypothetical protein
MTADVSEMLGASIIRALMMEAASTSETSVISNGLHDSSFWTTAIFR